MTKQTIVPGSLSQMATAGNKSLAETFMNADTLIIVDTSGSMASTDGTDQTRYSRACDELKKLQANLQGRIAVIAFSNVTQFCPGGVPTNFGQGTNMAEALDYIKPADGVVDRLILISDGEPSDPDRVLASAAKFETPISCIFIGQEGSDGAEFLRRLAKASGGSAQTIAQAGLLSERVEQLMLVGGAA